MKGFAKSSAKEIWKINRMAGAGIVERFKHNGGCHTHTGRECSAFPLYLSSLSALGGGHAVKTFLVCEDRPSLLSQEPPISAKRTKAFILGSGRFLAF